MSSLRLLAQMPRCSWWSTLPRMRASFSTSSSKFDDINIWGKMATEQELQSSVKQYKVNRLLDEEKEETVKKIQQLKDMIRKSEYKLTGLQRMKYKQEEYDKRNLVIDQLRAMRKTVQNNNIQIEPEVTHTVHEIRNDRKFRFAQSIANLMSAMGFGVICVVLCAAIQKKDRDVKEAEAAKQIDSTENNTVKDNLDPVVVSSIKSEDISTSSIFD